MYYENSSQIATLLDSTLSGTKVLSLAWRIRGSFITALSSLLYNPQLTLPLCHGNQKYQDVALVPYVPLFVGPLDYPVPCPKSHFHFPLQFSRWVHECLGHTKLRKQWYRSKLPSLNDKMGSIILLFRKLFKLNSLSQHITHSYSLSQYITASWQTSLKCKIHDMIVGF